MFEIIIGAHLRAEDWWGPSSGKGISGVVIITRMGEKAPRMTRFKTGFGVGQPRIEASKPHFRLRCCDTFGSDSYISIFNTPRLITRQPAVRRYTGTFDCNTNAELRFCRLHLAASTWKAASTHAL